MEFLTTTSICINALSSHENDDINSQNLPSTSSTKQLMSTAEFQAYYYRRCAQVEQSNARLQTATTLTNSINHGNEALMNLRQQMVCPPTIFSPLQPGL